MAWTRVPPDASSEPSQHSLSEHAQGRSLQRTCAAPGKHAVPTNQRRARMVTGVHGGGASHTKQGRGCMLEAWGIAMAGRLRLRAGLAVFRAAPPRRQGSVRSPSPLVTGPTAQRAGPAPAPCLPRPEHYCDGQREVNKRSNGASGGAGVLGCPSSCNHLPQLLRRGAGCRIALAAPPPPRSEVHRGGGPGGKVVRARRPLGRAVTRVTGHTPSNGRRLGPVSMGGRRQDAHSLRQTGWSARCTPAP